ncbi:magnesium transporter [Aureivirga marina]|uniref:magnesium transporter n=1 Tax=Aureivirga marina TaxID=1182451 RepID=UPI0018CAA94B|nr:magnesium transporter [Aureivirga marina]
MMQFELTKEIIREIKENIANQQQKVILDSLKDIHPADIADIMDELNFEEAIFIFKILDKEKKADVLTELDDDSREKVLNALSSKEIAEEIDDLETDDAADIIAELTDQKKEEVISQIEDTEHAKDIVDLLRYPEDTAGGLMGKELVKVNEDWSMLRCVKEMREQAQEIDVVHTVYVVDKDNVLKGILSLKSMLTTSTKTPVKEIYRSNIISVKTNEKDEEVAKIMQKYDLIVVPVVDELGHLVGKITIDDIVDVIKEEADRDYQMAAGISEDVEADDTIFKLTKARLPWLLIGMLGGLGAATIITHFQDGLQQYLALVTFIPLIQATAGNVGVQSAAIMVQGIANNSLNNEIVKRLLKELTLGLVNGVALATIFLIIGLLLFQIDLTIALTIGFALSTVIILAAIIGTFIPLFLHKRGIDPAVATGPFITTSNDVFGILIYFVIAKLILGF